jgi:adenylate cyclase class 2
VASVAKRRHEVEIKLQIADRHRTLLRLRELGARRLRSVHELNILFDSPRATLRKRGHLLRLRCEQPRGRGAASAVLTFKGPSRPNSRYKVREEAEVVVSDPTRLTRILAALGLRPVFRYEKFRTTYRISRWPRLLIEFDQTPVGDFLELEGPGPEIDRVARLLGYSPADYITRSYLALHAEACRRLGRPVRDMLFRRAKNSPVAPLSA